MNLCNYIYNNDKRMKISKSTKTVIDQGYLVNSFTTSNEKSLHAQLEYFTPTVEEELGLVKNTNRGKISPWMVLLRLPNRDEKSVSA